MKLETLLSTIEQGISRMKIKDFSQAVENLKTNKIDLMLFLQNNQINASEFNIVNEILTQLNVMLSKKIPTNLCCNIFDQYSIIFMLASATYGNIKKTNKILIEVLANSSKFDIYTKVNVNNKKISSADSQINELFWLIPLFCNPAYLTTFDYKKFIKEMIEINAKNSEFGDGYGNFVFSNLSSFEKDNYKQHLLEGSKELNKK